MLAKVRALHYLRDERSFEQKWLLIQHYFIQTEAGVNFLRYFRQQWIAPNGFATWRAFDSPPGFCKTNNSLESNNNTFKTVYNGLGNPNLWQLVGKLSSALRDNNRVPVVPHPNFNSAKDLQLAHTNRQYVTIERFILVANVSCRFIIDARNPDARGIPNLPAICTINAARVNCNCLTYFRDLKCWHILAGAKEYNLQLPPAWPSQQRLLRVGRAGRPRGARGRGAAPGRDRAEGGDNGLDPEDNGNQRGARRARFRRGGRA